MPNVGTLHPHGVFIQECCFPKNFFVFKKTAFGRRKINVQIFLGSFGKRDVYTRILRSFLYFFSSYDLVQFLTEIHKALVIFLEILVSKIQEIRKKEFSNDLVICVINKYRQIVFPGIRSKFGVIILRVPSIQMII